MIPRPLKIGIGGPVGSGKTALAEALCHRLRDRVEMAVITNDIYTKEDAEYQAVVPWRAALLHRRGQLVHEGVIPQRGPRSQCLAAHLDTGRA